MSKAIRRLAIIPARGGSKRIPKKNIRDFHGRPMLSYILNSALESKLFDKIHVSTESNEIFSIVDNLGFKPDFLRPEDLASDFIGLMEVLKYTVDTYKLRNEFFNQVWLLMPCSPLLTSTDLKEAAITFDNSGGPVLSVCEYPAPIEWAYQMSPDNRLTQKIPEMHTVRSQDLTVKYYDAGLFAIYNSNDISKSSKSDFNQNFYAHLIQREKAIDIDHPKDWEFAEKLFFLKKNK